jgi:hypothetical protein
MNAVESNIVSYAQVDATARTAAQSGDRIAWIKLSLTFLPLATPVSDAKVLTGRQKPLTEIAFVFAQIRTRDENSDSSSRSTQRRSIAGEASAMRAIKGPCCTQSPHQVPLTTSTCMRRVKLASSARCTSLKATRS